jgi:hypothetical protein
MNAQNDLDQQLNAFLREGPTELPYQSFDAVRDRTEQTRQRVFFGPWRTPTMNKFATIALGAAAVVVALVVGAQLLSSPNNNSNVGTDGSTPTPEATLEPTSSPSELGAPVGPFLVFDPAIQPPPFDEGPPITVMIPASGWEPIPENGLITKGDNGQDPPDATGAFLLTGDSGADAFYVYGDPCHWESTTPDTPATTVDEIVDALAAQASREATTPVDITLDGHPGKFITLTVPMIAPTRDEALRDCDQETFATYGVTADGPSRYQQGPGQVDEFWILDVDGQIVILDASYGPATSAVLVDELRGIAESATFEAP